MGIYIKGMEMPTSCRSCPFENGGDCYGGKYKYIMDVDDYEDYRHPNCPLTEVPEPHGRLIDSDKAVKDYHEYGISHMYDAFDLPDIMADSPTVIERSK